MPKGVQLPYSSYDCNRSTFEDFLEVTEGMIAVVANPMHHTNSTAIVRPLIHTASKARPPPPLPSLLFLSFVQFYPSVCRAARGHASFVPDNADPPPPPPQTDWAARRPGAKLVLFAVYTTAYWSTLVELATAPTTTDSTKIICPSVSKHYDFLEGVNTRLSWDTF